MFNKYVGNVRLELEKQNVRMFLYQSIKIKGSQTLSFLFSLMKFYEVRYSPMNKRTL